MSPSQDPVESLIREARARSRERGEPRVEEVVVGLHFTLTRLSDGSAGLSYTNPEGGGRPSRLLGMTAGEAVGFLESPRGLEVSAALSVVNSLLNTGAPGVEGDPLDGLIAGKDGGRAVMVGFFPGYVERLLGSGWEVHVLEMASVRKLGAEGVEVYPWWALDSLLGEADVVIVTGATLANRSLRYIAPLLASSPGARVLVGPSTPASGSLLGLFDALGYTRVVDPDACKRAVIHGLDARELFRTGCGVKRLMADTRGAKRI